MSPYTQIPQTSSPRSSVDGQDLLQGLQSIPSNFDLAFDDRASGTYLSPMPKSKSVENSLLNPETVRQPSFGSISSTAHSGGGSIGPAVDEPERRSWRNSCRNFWHRNQGLFLVSFSQFFGALMNVTTRLLELEGDGMHPFQILFVRQGLTMILCSTWMWWKKIPDFPFGAREVRSLLCVRAFMGFFGIYGMYYSLQYLPLADAVVITFLAPSVASYVCYLWLNEPFPRSAQYASLVSLLGVVLIARPASFFSDPSAPDTQFPIGNSTAPDVGSSANDSFHTPTTAQRMSAVGIALLGVLGSAGAFTSIRWIGSRAHPLLSVNYFAFFCTMVAALALTLSKPLHLSTSLEFALPANGRQWLLLIFLGSCGFVMQFLLTKGLSVGGRGGGARSTNMIYTNMLFALALDKMVFGQSPGLWSLGGSGLILGSALYVAMQGQQHQQVEMRTGDEEMGSEVGIEGRRQREDGEIGSEEEESMIAGQDMGVYEVERADRVGLSEVAFPPRSTQITSV